MAHTQWTVSRAGHGVTLEATALRAGEDLVVAVTGGDQPHVGSVSLAMPRESLRGDGAAGATVSTLNLTGHKDDAVGNLFADALSRRTGRPCVVACGIHVDGLSGDGVERVLALARALLDDLLRALDREEENHDRSADL